MAEKKTELLPAYLVVGSDELKAQAVIKRLWNRLEKLGNIDFNSQILEGSGDIDCQSLVDSLNTPPLAAPYRVVVIKDIDKAGKTILDAAADYLASPLSSTILVMTATKLTQQSRLYKAAKAIDNKAIIDASEQKRSELPAMIRKLAGSYQIGLSYEGATKIAELVGNSTVALNSEVKKLASYVLALGRSDANLDDVIMVIARSNQPSPWDFVDAFSRRELAQSLEILRSLPRETPVGLLYLCVVRLRELLYYKSLVALGNRNLAKALGKPDWQVRRLETLAAKFESAELRDMLARSARADARMKSGESAQLVLEEFLLATCR